MLPSVLWGEVPATKIVNIAVTKNRRPIIFLLYFSTYVTAKKRSLSSCHLVCGSLFGYSDEMEKVAECSVCLLDKTLS